MNEQPSMKLMFKGYQGTFPDKSFCKLRRRRKCENEQSAVTLPCLPVSFQHITCAQVGNKYELTSAQIGQKSNSELPPNSGGGVPAFYSQLGNNFAHILWALQIGKQCKPVQVYSFSWFPLWVNLRKLLVGEASPIPFERHLGWRLRIHSEYFYLLTSAQFA